MKTAGQIAYEAYCKSSQGKSLVSGAELPQWDKLDSKIVEAWEAAGSAVANHAITVSSLGD